MQNAMSDDFVGKAAVITGAGSGIGAGLARQAARIGMKVIVSDIVTDRAEQVALEIVGAGGQAHACHTDVRDAKSVEALSVFANQKFGDVRLLINNAGRTVFGASWELTPEQWHDALSLNIQGAIHGVCAFVPRMIQSGKRAAIVNVSSLGGLSSLPLAAPYIVSKHAILAFSECLYLEMEVLKLPIDVSVVIPGLVNTPIYDSSIVTGGGLGDIYRKTMQAASIAQGMAPDEAGRVIFGQVIDRAFWISTDFDMTKVTAESRSDFIRRQERPALPPPMRAALERAITAASL